jgi:hypothetical protein
MGGLCKEWERLHTVVDIFLDRGCESTSAISPSANTKPVMVAGITATQPRSVLCAPRTADIRVAALQRSSANGEPS